MPEMAVITLYINPEIYREESGEQLTQTRLQEIGQDVNNDAAPIYGYESWSVEFREVTARENAGADVA